MLFNRIENTKVMRKQPNEWLTPTCLRYTPLLFLLFLEAELNVMLSDKRSNPDVPFSLHASCFPLNQHRYLSHSAPHRLNPLLTRSLEMKDSYAVLVNVMLWTYHSLFSISHSKRFCKIYCSQTKPNAILKSQYVCAFDAACLFIM